MTATSAATYQVADLAGLLGISEWAIYESARSGTCPFPPIRVGRRIVFAKAAVDALLGLNEESGPSRGPLPDSTPDPITTRKDISNDIP